MSPQSTTAADQLPGALLARILQHVPLQQRLASCALVCKAWAPAAAAATHKLSLSVRQADGEAASTKGSAAGPSTISITATQPEESCLEVSGFTGWLQQHGSNLNNLNLDCIFQGDREAKGVKAQLQLPCPALVQLTSLSLGSCVVSMTPQQASAAVSTQALPQLLDLTLKSCKFASPASLQQLASTTSLTALELHRVWWDDRLQPHTAAGTGSQPSALAAVLQACIGLRRLRLCFWEREEESVFMPPSSLALLSGLQQLQDLDVFLPKVAPALLLPDLPCGLTRLVLARDPWWCSKPTHSLLQQDLSQLRALELYNVGVEAHLLSSMSKLQQLVIDRCNLLPEAVAMSSRVSALLAAVGELTLLHELKLVLAFEPAEVEEVPSAAFSALTAPSQLRVLRFVLSIDDYEVEDVPLHNVLQHMFPAGRQLGQLHTLVLGCSHVPLADLGLIATSCPALQTLDLVGAFEPGDAKSLRPLLDLSMLSSLRVGGAAWTDSAAGVVAELTQLTSLEWTSTDEDDSEYPDCGWYGPGDWREIMENCRRQGKLSRAGLAQLAALERLQYCSIDCYEPGSTSRLKFASSDQDGPVWVQILRELGVPEFVLQMKLQRQEKQQRRRVAELEHRACGS